MAGSFAHMTTKELEDQWDEVSSNTCWLYALFCEEGGCSGPMDPVIYQSGKFCCLEGFFHSNGDFKDEELGCIYNIEKVCCCVSGVSCGLNITCCNKDLKGSPPGRDDAFSEGQPWMKEVFWFYYCCCSGVGLSREFCAPIYHKDGKLCCFETSVTSGAEAFGEEGCLNIKKKTCCIVQSQQCPPTMSIGLGLCGKKCVGGEEEEESDVE